MQADEVRRLSQPVERSGHFVRWDEKVSLLARSTRWGLQNLFCELMWLKTRRLTVKKNTVTSETASHPAGQTVGVDLGDRYSQVCVLDAGGSVVQETRFATTPQACELFFRGLKHARVAIEVGTHSRWVERLVKRCGHEVFVANPRQVRLISHSSRKSDCADAERLARLARSDPHLLAPIHHRSESTHQDLALIRSRDALVQIRTALVNHVRGTLKSFSVRGVSCSTDGFVERIASQIPQALKPALEPVLETLRDLKTRIAGYQKEIERVASQRHPVVQSLSEIVGVGTLTALAFALVLEDPRRFTRSRDVPAYLGLVPRKHQSGERDPQMRISKTGDTLVRRLLVSAGHYILGPFGKDCELRRFGLALADRGGKTGKKRAVVAVARKLAVVMHRLWVTGEVYDPEYRRKRVGTTKAAMA
jgi:transposase